MRSSPECRLVSIGEDDGRFQRAIRRQYQSILFGRSDHPTKGAKESGSPLRSDRLLPHSDGAFLHTQSFSDAKLGPRRLSTTHRWCCEASVCFELRGAASMRSETRV